MRKPSAPAYPVAVIPLEPLLLSVPLSLLVLVPVVLGEVTLVQETLEGTEKVCASVRSAHWVEKEYSVTPTYDMWRTNEHPKAYLVEATVTSIINDLNCHVGAI
jgi:hypothetical protein